MRRVIRMLCDTLEMSPAELARTAGYAPGTVAAYLSGRRRPTRAFLLDLLDGAPRCDLTFDRLARDAGLRWTGSADPRRHDGRPFSEYLSTVRVLARMSRPRLAAELGVPVHAVTGAEHGELPQRRLLPRLTARLLAPMISTGDVVAAFPLLRPTAEDLDIQHRLREMRIFDVGDPARRDLEESLARDMAETAQRIARQQAWRIGRPDFADDVWGEGLALAIRFHDPDRGYFRAHLRARIRGLLWDLVRGSRQTGVTAVLAGHGPAVRRAESALIQQLSRFPTEREVAGHLGLPVHAVAEVHRAVAAAHPANLDDLDFLPREAAPGAYHGVHRRLRDLPGLTRELLYLHYHDGLAVPAVAVAASLPEQTVEEHLRSGVAALRAQSCVT
ncbi:helix-turn-helix domain-containing protein [Actinoplanes sp. NPDC024001]|uniref:helix-turn-helix domain-containing protein n=1 Tax=Actinoplanes sp. NPDC024001 TaxID=3154598 RepID=UPI0033F6A17E